MDKGVFILGYFLWGLVPVIAANYFLTITPTS